MSGREKDKQEDNDEELILFGDDLRMVDFDYHCFKKYD